MEVMEIRFQKSGQAHWTPNQMQVAAGSQIVVKYNHCQDLARVVRVQDLAPEAVALDEIMVERTAIETDLAHAAGNQADAKVALQQARQMVRAHHLRMKLTIARYTLDRHKLIFYFTADGRVDFRDLVRDLASVFKTRIELRQIGVRDEAKLLGGIGPCGRALCCSTFLGEFVPVSIKMAKNQNLSLNPTKISGLCGRLMCCLQFEDDMYEDAKAALPDYGERVTTVDGPGKVVGMNLLSHVLRVRLDGHQVAVDYDLEEIKVKVNKSGETGTVR
ncbi:PSP1 domain-containing protein [Loigolactobacillus zhaoyuanensis]|uniref:Stage 0 sporulation family protein n=1 Tax=Loigolactobacillus zhaoyuanensis TaxID=2486017 RepID=A0ABW8UIS8_9LACO|nr:stage 0 sporulation family protein [Loigolactobacillus zhaoyuanensis]